MTFTGFLFWGTPALCALLFGLWSRKSREPATRFCAGVTALLAAAIALALSPYVFGFCADATDGPATCHPWVPGDPDFWANVAFVGVVGLIQALPFAVLVTLLSSGIAALRRRRRRRRRDDA